MASTRNPAQRERAALCDLFVDVGPDAPTLCGDWTTRDLAAHLVVRERRPDAAIGILVPKAAGYLEKVQNATAEGDWAELIETVRSGPPMWSPTRIDAVDKATNTVEFFVHHEDVRRAVDGWEPRDLDSELTDVLTSMLTKMAKRLVKSSPVGITVHADGDAEPIVLKQAEPSVTVRGPVGELVLFTFGRQAHTRVEIDGDDASVAEVRSASFGI